MIFEKILSFCLGRDFFSKNKTKNIDSAPDLVSGFIIAESFIIMSTQVRLPPFTYNYYTHCVVVVTHQVVVMNHDNPRDHHVT